MRHVTVLVLFLSVGVGLTGAQGVREARFVPASGATLNADHVLSLAPGPSRSGLRTPLLPGKSTFDTLWFLPPAGRVDPSGSPFGWIVRNVEVWVDTLECPHDEALALTIHHDGLNDTLLEASQTSGANFIGTVFADSSAVSIATGIPPYAGRFTPSRPLSLFNARNATGSWILEIVNGATGTTGTLREWGLALEIARDFTSVPADPAGLPEGCRLYQNHPNPFNPGTTIRFSLPAQTNVTLAIFTVLGQHVRTLVQGMEEAGFHEVRFDGSNLGSGVYLCRLKAGTFTETKRLLLIR
jgi:hypothetical protein